MNANLTAVSTMVNHIARITAVSAVIATTGLGLVGCPTEGKGPDVPDGPDPVQLNSLTVANFSNEFITQVYVSPCSSVSWGANQIRTQIAPLESTVIGGLSDGCYDLLAVGDFGSEWVIFGVEFHGGQNKQFQLGIGGKAVDEASADSAPVTDEVEYSFLGENKYEKEETTN